MDRSFLKHAAIYGLASFLVQAGGFVLLPIYLRCLGPAEYGVLEVVGRLAETVGTVLLFGGFRQALMTFYQQAPDEHRQRQVVSSTLFLVAVSCLAGGLIAFFLAPSLGQWLAPDLSAQETLTPFLVRLAILGILLEPFSLVPLALLQSRVESGRYVGVVLAQFLVRVGLAVSLVRAFHWGVTGALVATALTGMLFGIGLTVREVWRAAAWPCLAEVRRLFLFALPMLPSGLCFFVLHHGDRFFLLRHCSPEEVGTYALGYKLAMIVAVFSLNPLYMVWAARMYAVAKTPEAPEAFGQVFTRILAAFLFVGLGLCLFAREVVLLLGGAVYLEAVAIVPPVVLACFWQTASSLMDAGFYVRHRTGVKLAISLAATAVMLVLYLWLIPLYGGMGAALATLGGFGFLAAGTWFATQRIFPVRYEWPRLAALLALAVGLWLAGTWLPDGLAGWIGKTALWLSAPVVAWIAGLATATEKDVVRQLIGKAAEKLGVHIPQPFQEASR